MLVDQVDAAHSLVVVVMIVACVEVGVWRVVVRSSKSSRQRDENVGVASTLLAHGTQVQPLQPPSYPSQTQQTNIHTLYVSSRASKCVSKAIVAAPPSSSFVGGLYFMFGSCVHSSGMLPRHCGCVMVCCQ